MEVSRYDGEGKPVLDHLVVEGELSAGEFVKFLCVSDATELTIAGGVITATQSYHDIDTAGGAGTDDLDTINGGDIGSILVIRAEHSDRTVVVKAGTGNLRLNSDFSMDNTRDVMVLMRISAISWVEISRSSNT